MHNMQATQQTKKFANFASSKQKQCYNTHMRKTLQRTTNSSATLAKQHTMQNTTATFCSKNKTPFVLAPSAGLSDFQTAYAMQLSQDPNFDFWCIEPMCDQVGRGPTMFVYYTKDGVLHGDRVGVKRVIRQVTSH